VVVRMGAIGQDAHSTTLMRICRGRGTAMSRACLQLPNEAVLGRGKDPSREQILARPRLTDDFRCNETLSMGSTIRLPPFVQCGSESRPGCCWESVWRCQEAKGQLLSEAAGG
jgi:hypothetical protein